MKNSKIKMSKTQMKEYIKTIPKNKRWLFGSIIIGVLVFSIVMTIMLNRGSGSHTPIYPTGISTSESAQIFSKLKGMGADVKINTQGEVTVPVDEHDIWILQLAAEGYPKSAPPYDIESNNIGMTTTDAEREQWYLYGLQDRIQLTLKSLSGVENAIVTINLAKTNTNIWDEATEAGTGSASVTLTLKDGVELDEKNVAAIKYLVSAGVADLTPEVVRVIDAKTMLELSGEDVGSGGVSDKNLEFELTVQAQLENNIMQLLTPRYGAGGVVATAKVTINYDKMLTDQKIFQGDPETGDGFVTDSQGQLTTDGNQTIGGIVGENDNTDLPEYPYIDPDSEDTTNYAWNTQTEYSYVQTQIEKGMAELERATISVLVDEENLTDARREELIDLISKSVDIAPENIAVSTVFSSVTPGEVEPGVDPGVDPDGVVVAIPLWIYIAVGVGALLIVLLAVFLVRRKRRKKKLLKDDVEAAEFARTAAEIEEYKKQLSAAAKGGSDAKNEAIVEEVRDFARTNPEITASLLRSWLKDGE